MMALTRRKMMALTRRNLWFAVFVLVVFSIGAAAGVVADRYRPLAPRQFGFMRQPGPFGGDIVERISTELKLTAEQRARLETLLGRMRAAPPRREQITERMSRELGLSAEQRTELEAVFKRNGDRLEQFRSETGATFDELRKQLDSEIAAILTPEQREKFEQERARRERFRPREPGRGRRPPQ